MLRLKLTTRVKLSEWMRRKEKKVNGEDERRALCMCDGFGDDGVIRLLTTPHAIPCRAVPRHEREQQPVLYNWVHCRSPIDGVWMAGFQGDDPGPA